VIKITALFARRSGLFLDHDLFIYLLLCQNMTTYNSILDKVCFPVQIICSFAISRVMALSLAVVTYSYINFILPTWVSYKFAYSKYCIWIRGGTAQGLKR